MAELNTWRDVAPGGRVVAADAVRMRTGGWRTGTKPAATLSTCVNCLLCWLSCPDSAVVLEQADFAGFDFDWCKGCGICAEVCPVDAIEMVAEETVLPELGVRP